ncbi:MAG TPA: hypothetical protein VH370_22375 [Humisphaera sp.]|nr:hypothetical protein [Humisphaera sp.]
MSSLATAGLAGARKIIYSPTEIPSGGELRCLGWAARHWPVHIVCDAPSRRLKLIASGLPADRCHVIAPGVDPIQGQRDERRRRELGLADDELVVLAPGESTHAAGHRYAIWATAILQVLDKRWRVLIWGRGGEIDRLANLVANFGQADLLCIAERKLGKKIEFEKLLGVADFAVLTPGERASMVPAAQCAASGLPIVRWPHSALDEILPRDAVAASVPRRRPALLAQQLMALAANRSACDPSTEKARRHAESSLGIDRFVQSYRGLYCGK